MVSLRLTHFDRHCFNTHIRQTSLGVEICTLLGYYAAYSGNSPPTFRDNLLVPSARVKKSKTVQLPRKVGRELPLNAAKYHRREQISPTSRRRPESLSGCCVLMVIVIRLRKFGAHVAVDITGSMPTKN